MDHLPRSIRHAWRQAAEAFVGGHDPGVVAERAEKAIAKTLRREGPIDWLEGLADSVQESWRVGGSVPIDQFVDSLDPRAVTGVYSGFVDAARVAGANGPQRGVDALETVAHDGVRRMVRKLCLAPLEPEDVGTVGFPTHAVVTRVVDDVLQRLQVVPLARLLATAGQGRSVRAPRSALQRKATKELLGAPI